MPNKRAKDRKRKKRILNKALKSRGRTSAQYNKRKKKDV